MTLTIKLSDKLISSIREQVNEGEFKNVDAFIEKAVESELLTHKRRQFAESSDIDELLKSADFTEGEVLEDFEKYREKLLHKSESQAD